MAREIAVQRRQDLLAQGYDPAGIAQLIASGQLSRVRRGAYAEELPADPVQRHRQLILATAPAVSSEAVVSHASAAVLYGLPVWPDVLSRVHVSRNRPGGGRRGSVVHVHPARLEPPDLSRLGCVAVTSLARTVADCARTLSYPRAVAVADVALRMGLRKSDLVTCLDQTARCRGAGQARRAADFMELGAESVGESFSRVVLRQAGVPTLQLQFGVRDRFGATFARADFCWKERRTLGEFDGRVKYGRSLEVGETPGDAVFREKVREDRLRDLGWEVVRWTWDDLAHPTALADRLGRAFARGSRR